MGVVVPILIVVIFWMIVGVFAVTIFRRWLRVPTEAEVEQEHESHEAEAHKDKELEQTAAR